MYKNLVKRKTLAFLSEVLPRSEPNGSFEEAKS